MGLDVEYYAKQAKREAQQNVVEALRKVAATCSDSTSISDALRRVADEIEDNNY
jgi:hypothetical protein